MRSFSRVSQRGYDRVLEIDTEDRVQQVGDYEGTRVSSYDTGHPNLDNGLPNQRRGGT
jgi:hypothetical protein